MIIDVSLIQSSDGKWLFNGRLFNGVIFSFCEGRLISSVKCIDGNLAGNYQNEYFDDSFDLKVNWEFLTGNDGDHEGPAQFQGKLFTGMAYDMDDGVCTGETRYIDGWPKSYQSYFKTGDIEGLELLEKEPIQSYFWHQNGVVKTIEISCQRRTKLNADFDQRGCLISIGIYGPYFEEVEQFADYLTFPVVISKKYFDGISCGSRVCFFGDSFEDEILEKICNSGGFDKTKEVIMTRTRVTIESISILAACANLKKLTIEDGAILESDLVELGAKYPNLRINLNRRQIFS